MVPKGPRTPEMGYESAHPGAFLRERNLCLHPVFKATRRDTDAQKRSEVGLPQEGVVLPGRLTRPRLRGDEI